jgi:hypothetical protein
MAWFGKNKEEMRPLPRTVEELDALVARVVKNYNLPEGDDSYDSIVTAILHMPQTAANAKDRYFGEYVWKLLANKAAWIKSEEFKAKRAAAAKAEAARLNAEKAAEEAKRKTEAHGTSELHGVIGDNGNQGSATCVAGNFGLTQKEFAKQAVAQALPPVETLPTKASDGGKPVQNEGV